MGIGPITADLVGYIFVWGGEVESLLGQRADVTRLALPPDMTAKQPTWSVIAWYGDNTSKILLFRSREIVTGHR